jgi:hypothetical protein
MVIRKCKRSGVRFSQGPVFFEPIFGSDYFEELLGVFFLPFFFGSRCDIGRLFLNVFRRLLRALLLLHLTRQRGPSHTACHEAQTVSTASSRLQRCC